MRTTSSVEAYNCVLNKYIVNKGNFFNFIHDLRSEEYLKREEMSALIFSGAATENKRRAVYLVTFFLFLYLIVCMCLCFILIIFFILLKARDKLIETLTQRLLGDDEFSEMDFLRQIIFERSDFTHTFIDFESVGPVPEGEEVEEGDEEEDNDEDEQQQEEGATLSSIRSIPSPSPSMQSVGSSSSSSSSQFDKRLICKLCNQRQKNCLMQCSHSICTICFNNMKEARKLECANIRSKVRRQKEEFFLKCPFDVCAKTITDVAMTMCLDL